MALGRLGYAVFVGAVAVVSQSTFAQLPQAGSAWRVAVAGGWGWESNVAMRNPPYQRDAATVAAAEASGVMRTQRTRLEFSAQGGLVRYQTLRSFDRYSYELREDLQGKLSSRLNGFLRSSARMSVASQATSLDETTVLLPLILSRTQAAGAGFTYRASPLTTASVEGRYTHATFDAAELGPASSIGGRARLARRYSPFSAYGVSYLVDEYTESGARNYVQSVAAEWASRTARIDSRVGVGASSIGTSIGSLSRLTPTGSAYVQARVGRGATHFQYARFAGQSFGLGRVLVTDQIGAGYERSPFRRTSVLLRGDRAWSRDDTTPLSRAVTTNISARIARQFETGFTVGGEGFLQRRDQTLTASDRGVRILVGYAAGSRGMR